MTFPGGIFGGGSTIPKQQTLKRKGENFSPVGDLYAPFFDVVFYRAESETGSKTQEALEAKGLGAPKTLSQVADSDTIGSSSIQLRSVGGGLQMLNPQGPDTPTGQLLNYKSSLQVTMLSAAALQATLTLQPPYFDAVNIIDDKLIKFGSLMEIQWGYFNLETNQPEISDKGLFTITQPAIKFGLEVSITIGGFDILSTSLKSTDTRCEWLRSEYESDLSILEKLVSKAGSGLELLATGVTAESRLRRKKTRDVIQSDDDWTFFRRLCRQNDVTFLQFGGTIILYDQEERDLAKHKYRLTWFMQPQDQWDIPMLSFETNPIMGYFAGQGSRGSITYCRDSETGEVTSVSKDPSKPGVGQSGAGRAQTAEKSHKKETAKTGSSGNIAPFGVIDEEMACTSGRIYVQPCRKPNQEEETDRENREVLRNFNTRASALCPGVPGMIPQIITNVVNVSKTFSGNYRVMKVVHNIGSGYTMQVDLLRAASTGDERSSDTNVQAQTTKEPTDARLQSPMMGELVTPKAGDDTTNVAGNS